MTHKDARNRAVRTFLFGLVSTILAALPPTLLALSGSVQFTREWAVAAVAALAAVALSAAASYVGRFAAPPKQDKPSEQAVTHVTHTRFDNELPPG